MAMEELLHTLRTDPDFRDAVVHWRTLPSRQARTAPFPDSLHPDLIHALRATGIDALFFHQREAFDRVLGRGAQDGGIRAGEDLVVATPTASGKTLCYNLPVFQTLLESMDADSKNRGSKDSGRDDSGCGDSGRMGSGRMGSGREDSGYGGAESKPATPGATALYLFPTKALSQDQVAGMERLNEALPRPTKAMTYDGDTPASARKIIRERGEVVVTNPYMLHAGILPNHTRWVRFFRGLAFVVVDEMHTLTGIYGSHVANVIRRLLRICAHYGSWPRFIFSSATLANPAELAGRLLGRPVGTVIEDGSPRGEKHFVFYNPPLVNRALGLRRSGLEEARRLAQAFRAHRVQTLVFCRTRNGVEVMVKYLKDHSLRRGFDPEAIRGYRGGYLPDLRREIEKGLREGAIDTVVATNALELGIDIGSLDACILTGYPGSVASTLQQAGRSGRKAGSSLALLVGRSDAMDQYVLDRPDYVLGRSPEAGVVDPDNLVIRVNHLKCAAFELPFREGERFGEDDTTELLEYLEKDARILRKVKDRWHWMSRTYPAEKISLHAGDLDNFTVLDAEKGHIIGEVDRPSAMSMIHPGAIYGHQGAQYHVDELDYDRRRAVATRIDSDYYTEAEVETEIRVHHLDRHYFDQPYFDQHYFEQKRLDQNPDGARSVGYEALHGEVGLTKTATLYKKIRFYTRENVGTGDIDLPPEEMHTEAFFLTLSLKTAEQVGLYDGERPQALVGLAGLLRSVAPLFVRCASADLGIKAEMMSAHFERPTIILYDDLPGGVGLCEKIFELHREMLTAMARILAACPCRAGCPACIGPSGEGSDEVKVTARALVDRLLAEAGAHFGASSSTGPSAGPSTGPSTESSYGPSSGNVGMRNGIASNRNGRP